MKSLRPVLLLLAIAAAAAATMVFYYAAGSRRAAMRWRPLPKGGEVAFHSMTFGTEHAEPEMDMSWPKRFAQARTARSLKPLLVKPRGARSFPSKAPSVFVWLLIRNRAVNTMAAPMGWCVLRLPDGQTFDRSIQSFAGVPPPGTPIIDSVGFNLLPARAKTLVFSREMDGTRLDFEFDNPAFVRGRSRWDAKPLPQSQTRDGLLLSLESMEALPAKSAKSGSPSNWIPQPRWKITHDGKDVSNLVRISQTYADEDGNASPKFGLFSAPAWKVHATATLLPGYPFPDERVQWLGTFDSDAPGARDPMQSSLKTIRLQSREVRLLGLFGPGMYEIGGGGAVEAAPVNPVRVPGQGDVRWDAAAQNLKLRIAQPALVTACRNDPDGRYHFVFRDEKGSGRSMQKIGRFQFDDFFVTFCAVPDGVTRAGFINCPPLEFEFIVKPPPIPASSEE